MSLGVCPSCGASNKADAEWCGQCFTRFDELTAEPPAQESAPVAARERVWICRLCDTKNPVEASACQQCQASIYDSFGPGHLGLAASDPSAALRRALIFPGGGYGALGLSGIGFVTGFLAAISALVGAALLASGELLGLVLIAVFLAVWVVSVVDVTRLLQGVSTPLLRPRVLSVAGGSVLVVLLIVVASVFSSVSSG